MKFGFVVFMIALVAAKVTLAILGGIVPQWGLPFVAVLVTLIAAVAVVHFVKEW